MKIVIVGAGISGCTTYLELRKHLPKPPSGDDHSITIYEAYDAGIDTTSEDRGEDGPTHSSTLIVGGGLGVAGNGLNVIKRLDTELLREIVRDGYSTAIMNMKSRNGTVLVRMLPAGKPATSGEGQKSMNMVGCSRHSLWRSIRMKVPHEAIVRKRVSEVVAKQDGRNLVHFADGSSPVEADLVIGADGLKSSAKRAIFQDKEDPYPPHYE